MIIASKSPSENRFISNKERNYLEKIIENDSTFNNKIPIKYRLITRVYFKLEHAYLQFVLMSQKVNLFEKDNDGLSALDYASDLEKINILTRHGAKYEAPFKALMRALHFSKTEQVSILPINIL